VDFLLRAMLFRVEIDVFLFDVAISVALVNESSMTVSMV